jgi:hypothetical protein
MVTGYVDAAGLVKISERISSSGLSYIRKHKKFYRGYKNGRRSAAICREQTNNRKGTKP